jgi:hypothetical protein
MSASPRIIHPGVGVGPFELGRTREELWSRTDSNVLAYLGKSGPGERSDEFLAHGVHAHYREGRVFRLSVFPRMHDRRVAPVVLEGEDVSEYGRDDLLTLLELQGHACTNELERVRVPALGLVFGFREDYGQPERLDFVFVDVIVR